MNGGQNVVKFHFKSISIILSQHNNYRKKNQRNKFQTKPTEEIANEQRAKSCAKDESKE